MKFPERLVIASRNPGKIREIKEICVDWPVRWLIHTDVSWPEVEETGPTYLDNAVIKAREVSGAAGLPAVADDSGIEVDALGGEPGPHSARFAGDGATDEENLARLIERIREKPAQNRTARYRCLAVCGWPDGGMLWAEGTCEGRLVLEPRGGGGFGYDPIFVPVGQDRTMSELPPGAKNAISHRGKAFRALGELIRSRPTS